MNRLRINKMGVLSVAKIQGLIGLIIGLLIGLIYGFFIIVYSLFGAGMMPNPIKIRSAERPHIGINPE